uniref:Uncharacterized protein n=1 Tax=Kalanchoe fedtschenkoi TaxID=63787 RepID=A0A7N0V801_KALFE
MSQDAMLEDRSRRQFTIGLSNQSTIIKLNSQQISLPLLPISAHQPCCALQRPYVTLSIQPQPVTFAATSLRTFSFLHHIPFSFHWCVFEKPSVFSGFRVSTYQRTGNEEAQKGRDRRGLLFCLQGWRQPVNMRLWVSPRVL